MDEDSLSRPTFSADGLQSFNPAISTYSGMGGGLMGNALIFCIEGIFGTQRLSGEGNFCFGDLEYSAD
jgi:hypothetical protein